MTTEPFGHVLNLFGWTDPNHDATCGSLERARLVAVASKLNNELDAGTRAKLEALPDDAYLAIIHGCDTYRAAFHGDELNARVARWIEVETAEVGERVSFDGVARSAGCDKLVRAHDGAVQSVDLLERIGKLAIDFDSDLSDRLLTRYERTVVVPSDGERALTREKLVAALDILRTTSRRAYHFVVRMVDVVCCRTAADDDGFYTASEATTLGVVHLLNTHLPRITPAKIASELVHEAIHQALFCHELIVPAVPTAPVTVRSPWTNAELDLYAFTHACFVWYGVAQLWRLPTAPASDATVVRQRDAAEVGFVRDPLAAIGAEAAGHLPAAVIGAITQMTATIGA